MTDRYYRSRFPLPLPQYKNGIGANLHFLGNYKNALADLKSAGMKWVRTDILWHDIERTPGVYSWHWYDEHFNYLKANGLRSVNIISFTNPNYFSKREAEDPTKTWCLDFSNTAQVDAYKKFVKALIARYGNSGHIWETGNELFVSHFYHPGRDPIHAAQHCYITTTAIREVSKYEWVAVNILALNQYKSVTDYVNTFMSQTPNPFSYADIFSFHPYTWTSEPHKENVNPNMIRAGIKRMRDCLNKYKPKSKTLRLICSEHGGSEFQGYSFLPGEGTDILGVDKNFNSGNWIHYWMKPTITYNLPDPKGGNTAIRLASADKDPATNPHSGIRVDRPYTFNYPCFVTTSFWARTLTGTLEIWFGPRDVTKSACVIDNVWRQYHCTYRLDGPSNNNFFMIYESEYQNTEWELAFPLVELNTLPEHVASSTGTGATTDGSADDAASDIAVEYSIDNPQANSPLFNHRRDIQSYYTIDSIKACLESGVGLYIYYNYKDDGADPNEFYSTFGLVEEDHVTKKPIFFDVERLIKE